MRRGGGGIPRDFCVRAFSRESLDPPPGPGGETTPQVWTCAGPNGTPCRSGRGAPGPAGPLPEPPVGGIATTARAGRWTRR